MSGPLDTFDHVVVLMLENRSFDNMLGYLYAPHEVPRGQTFDGVIGKDLWNPAPDDVERPPDGRIAVARNPGTFESMEWPKPDPGEEYSHVNTQAFDLFNPESNRFQPVKDVTTPFNAPSAEYRCGDEPAPEMLGFVNDYVSNFKTLKGRLPTLAEYEIIMRCFTPSAETGVPVISTLAKSFAVCDQWHCAVPSQTFCNRSFFNSASSSGFVVNGIDLPDYAKWPLHNTQETIFNRLQKHGRSWRVYFDAEDIFSLTLLIHFQQLEDYAFSHFCHMDEFYRDVRKGRLPDYAFIEPRLFFNHNDEHPPVDILGSEHSSVLAGEILIKEIYDAIRTSSSSRGSNAENTLFTITYDEHGGCFDHVPPPCAPPPDPEAPAGEMGFRFDRLGVRIPTIFISSHVEAGTVVNEQLWHTSMIRTLSRKWHLGHLTDRDRQAPTFENVLGGTCRPGSSWPEVTARPYEAKRRVNRDHPLNHLQESLIRTVAGLFGEHDSLAQEALESVGGAVKYMKRKLKSLKRRY